MSFSPELAGRWNHNTHYYPLALAATPCSRALDVGCGEGDLLRVLAPRCDHVVGVDPWSEPMDLPNVTVVRSDFLSADLPPSSFDLVCSFASLHHMPFKPALKKMVSLVAPGGQLVVVGLARYTPTTWLLGASGIVPHRVMSRVRGYADHRAPVREPTMTWRETRSAVRAVVPGGSLRYRLYWRWSLEWSRPA